jgi:glycosyltransferase involved in cell wall biosynthesis
MPCYPHGPGGGFRVVYEYANRLVSRGHTVAVVHARRSPSAEQRSFLDYVYDARKWLMDTFQRPEINWHKIDKRVELRFVPAPSEEWIPDGDVIFATAWHTLCPVLKYSDQKGEKCYLIQHYETWMGEKELVDATWRSSVHKIVVSKWLYTIGKELGSDDLTYIPNGIDPAQYRLTQPLSRGRRVAMVFSSIPFKGASDGIKALEIAKAKHPDLEAVLFGATNFRPHIPSWIEYYNNPAQDFIVTEIYNKSSIFLCPSLSEGFALPPAEAAACGSAIVATDCGGIRDFIENGTTGLLSPPQDPEALAANLCKLLENEDLRMRLANAVNRSISHFNWERSTNLMEEFLDRVVRNSSMKNQATATE